MSIIAVDYGTIQGGGLTETDLWTNPSPSSTLADTTVTLSDSIANYDYIRVDYKLQGHNDTYSATWSSEMAQAASGFTNEPVCGISGYYSSSPYIRFCVFTAATSCRFVRVFQINGTGGTNEIITPLKIVGLK